MIITSGEQRGTQRDYRLDFFRGLALLFIFLNHIPGNDFSWITNKHFGISDATEIFVFISGYAAALAYSRRMTRDGFRAATGRILHRAGEVYGVHILLVLVLAVEAIWLFNRTHNINILAYSNIITLMADPKAGLLNTLLLTYRPLNMDVLPLYIVLLMVFPAALRAMMRRPLVTLGASALIWVVAGQTGINLPGYLGGSWYFNPFAWQFLFMLGAFASLNRDSLRRLTGRHGQALTIAAIAYLVFGLYLAATFYTPSLVPALPQALHDVIHPISKTNLSLLRILHFLAAAYLVSRWMPASASFLTSTLARPLIVTGQHSLPVFALGIALSFTGYAILREVDGSLLTQGLVSLAGILLLVGTAEGLKAHDDAVRAKARSVPGNAAHA
ncbi:MAG: OpgC domain-containing protein [Alphaproteobacteria bacterium]|nr:OpgC domain-containing protein [Alphaproteobacteria bacterium]